MIHRDLKPANILLDANDVAHIADFGFSVTLRDKEMQSGRAVGTYLYMAPEVCRMEPFDKSADVHSFGIVLFELFTGVQPYPEIREYADFYKTVIVEESRPHIRSYADVPEGIMDIAEQCWNPDRKKRPSMGAVVDAIFKSIVNTVMPPDEKTNPANAFWMNHFKGQFSVPWIKFVETLKTTVTVNGAIFPVLEPFLCIPPSESIPSRMMTMERFQHNFLYFGRWFESPGEPLIDEMVKLFQAPWYFHEMDSAKAQSLLTGRAGGTFMIRLSLKDHRTPFALSWMVKGKGKICHNRIYRLSHNPFDAERYSLPGFGSFRTINDLVIALIDSGTITEPCGRRSLAGIVYMKNIAK